MENLDLTQILKDCPKGTKLYSPIFGEVKLVKIGVSKTHPIRVQHHNGQQDNFTKDGRYFGYQDDECMLFPSKDNRDWSTFKIEQPKPELKFEPFQKVLVRDTVGQTWKVQLYSHYRVGAEYSHICINGSYRCCIPYEGNEALLGTTNEPKGDKV